jgi:LmbE family N-acetylglucosaminyl deacetylase
MSIRPACRFVIRLLPVVVTVCLAGPLHAGAGPSRPLIERDAAEIQLALQGLGTLGSVLYVAAHPDDENTALLSYLSRERHLRVGYLSMTRGDGGQNLIGPEVGAALGLIRTQELMSARRIDGAEQYFTRAIDFGYSKSTDEALAFWGHEETLADVVWAIRQFRPDVIVTRFTPELGGHGHHTASAKLAEEAFHAAADPARFPEQLPYAGAWQARRLMWNAFRFGNMPDDPSRGGIEVDLGAYSPLLGRSYSEIAGESRSMHKSQGFGAAERRGTFLNRLVTTAGDAPKNDLMDGVDTGWTRVKGGAAVGRMLEEARRRFDPLRPEAIVPQLLAARSALERLPADAWVRAKSQDLDDLVRACAGLWVEAIAARPTVTPGSALKIELSVLQRAGAPFTLERIDLPFGAQAAMTGPAGDAKVTPRPLELNRPLEAAAELRIPADQPITQPYWLAEPGTEGRFRVEDPALLGLPETPAFASARFVLKSGAHSITLEAPLLYRWVDRVEGERYRRCSVVPPVTVRFENPVTVVADPKPRSVGVIVRAFADGVEGRVSVRTPEGWTVVPADAVVKLAAEGDETTVRFQITPGVKAQTGTMTANAQVGGARHTRGLISIDYPHVPQEEMFPPAEARLVRIQLATRGTNIGYLMGSGDGIPEALRQVGYTVTLLGDDDVAATDLSAFHAIVAGVRAYNTRPRLLSLQPRLIDYVEKGGTLIVQYNTAERRLNDALGPYPFSISRDRVSEETAAVTFLNPRHPLLTAPNRITQDDFSGWVQERGLYFANPWDPKYETVLAAHDAGEGDLAGGILYARHGRGVFIYTGLSWFRELPAGVPGAYRLFVNMVSARP